MPPRILVINPGSTGTKLALYEGERPLHEAEIPLERSTGAPVGVLEQLPERQAALLKFIQDNNIDRVDAISARGGPLRPLDGGTYRVDAAMLADLRLARYGEHASLLGALLAQGLAERWGVPAFVVDPVTVDELDAHARISGLPEITRSSRSHALSLKMVTRLAAAELGAKIEETRFVAAHLGGGISIAAMRGGRIVDVNDGLLGMGPFSPNRVGALPLRGLLDLAFAPGANRTEITRRLARGGGLFAYLGTDDLREVARRIDAGDAHAGAVFEAMAYQIAKEIGAMSVALSGRVDAVILTGGLSRSERLVQMLSGWVGSIGRVLVYPGEREMEALALGALRVLDGGEPAKSYAPVEAVVEAKS